MLDESGKTDCCCPCHWCTTQLELCCLCHHVVYQNCAFIKGSDIAYHLEQVLNGWVKSGEILVKERETLATFIQKLITGDKAEAHQAAERLFTTELAGATALLERVRAGNAPFMYTCRHCLKERADALHG